jgi:hypothetical protein
MKPDIQRKTVLVITTVSIAIAVVLTLLIERLISSGGDTWGVAIQASSTVLLVAITGIYAYLTYRLVQVQERPLTAIRLAAQEDAARKLSSLLASKAWIPRAASKGFPVDLTSGPPNTTNMRPQELSKLGDDVRELAPQLPPALAAKSVEASTDLWRAAQAILSLSSASDQEQAAANEEGRSWQADKARLIYYGNVRDLMASSKPEWDSIVHGDLVTKAWEEVNSLQTLVKAHLES